MPPEAGADRQDQPLFWAMAIKVEDRTGTDLGQDEDKASGEKWVERASFAKLVQDDGVSPADFAEAVRRVDAGEACATRWCNAGGPEEDGGHVFDIPVETDRTSSAECRCGMDAMTWSMMNGP